MKLFTHVFHFLILVIVTMAVAVVFIFYSTDQVRAIDYQLPAGQMTGWGWTDTFGWISLNCLNVYAGENDGQINSHCSDRLNFVDYGVTYNPLSGSLGGNMWADNIGWVSFQTGGIYGSIPTIEGGDSYPYTAQMNLETGIISGWAVATFDDNDFRNNAWIRFRASETCQWGTGVSRNTYCTRMNDNNRLVGWAWSGGDTGLGWVRFEDSFSGGPYLQTQYSDIYSGGTISGSQAPEGLYNATYCILSGQGNSINLTSSESCLLGNIDLDFPQSSGSNYQSSIVNLDLASLQTLAGANYLEGQDYGIIDSFLPVDGKLNNQVFYFTGLDDYYLNTNKTFYNSDSSGAGTIVIDGNLHINADLFYESSIVNGLEKLASVAFIVLGDVIIDPTVSQIVGSYIVLGEQGIFDTGDDSEIIVEEVAGNQFILKGMVIAKQIILNRVYFVGLAPAEIFEYDGRALVNTPPGLVNIVGYLPNWIR